MLERRPDGTYTIPSGEDPPTEIQPHTNIINVTAPAFPNTKIRTYAIDSPVDTAPHYEMCPLRSSYYKLPYNMYVTAGKCRELLYWDESTRFCGVCGNRMKMHTEISKCCEKCGKEVWPQLATAVIVLVRRGSEMLLVHANNFRGNFYGLVAGFVETGETLEEAVQREVLEEQPAMAISLRTDGGLQRRIRQWRHTAAKHRTQRRSMVRQRQSARNTRKTVNSKTTDRQLSTEFRIIENLE